MKTCLLAIARLVAVCLLIMVGASIGGWYALSPPDADASRNSSGTYSLASSPVTSSQVIGSSLWNTTFVDIASEIGTNSLDRLGRGGMLAALRGIDGTLAAPALSFTSETGSGLWRNGAGDVRMSILGALRENWTSTGVAITGTQTTTGTATFATGGIKALIDGTTIATDLGIWVGANATSPSTTNYSFLAAATETILNATTGNPIDFRINNSQIARVSGSGVTIGASGTAIGASYGATYSVAFGSPANGACTLSAQTLTGVALGGVCVASVDSGIGSSTIFDCSATGANSITVRGCNATGGAFTIGTINVRVRVFQP